MSTAPTRSATLGTDRLVLIGLLAGLLGGMFGVGGGLLIVPGLVLFGVQQRLAHGTSLAAWPVAPALATGGVIGDTAATKTHPSQEPAPAADVLTEGNPW